MTLLGVYKIIGSLWIALGVAGAVIDWFMRRGRRGGTSVRPPPMVDLTITNPQTRARRRTWVN